MDKMAYHNCPCGRENATIQADAHIQAPACCQKMAFVSY